MNTAPAGWHPDPENQTRLRYWDGGAWTEHVHQPMQAPHAQAAATAPALVAQAQAQISAEASTTGTAVALRPAAQAPATQSPTTHALAAQSPATQGQTRPVQPYGNLPTNRSLLKTLLLSLITFGIYAVWVTASSGEDLNRVADRHDNRRTMNFWLVALLLGPITFGLVTIFWWHRTSARIGGEQRRRGLPQTISAGTYWGWSVLGSLIVIGPFVFLYKWLGAMNALCADYNRNG